MWEVLDLNYKDSAEKRDSIKSEYYNMLLSKANVGSSIFFGSYEQDNNALDGKEDIEWQVLKKENNKVMLISKYILDFQQYNITNATTTWEDCSLRKWLNEDFINEAFDSDEQDRILLSGVGADKNPDYLTSPGNNTTDKIFLLSIVEAKKLFGSNEERQCKATAYSCTKGEADETNNCNWWLRSPGYRSNYAVIVLDTGFIYSYGYNVGFAESFEGYGSDGGTPKYTFAGVSGIRPVLWVRVDS